jgi:hypothetical protein
MPGNTNTNTSALRCSVDGQRLPNDITGSFGTFDNSSYDVEEMPAQNAPTRHVAWYRARFTTAVALVGPARESSRQRLRLQHARLRVPRGAPRRVVV